MSNKTWLATTPTPGLDLGLTQADLIWELDPGWQRTTVWYADSEVLDAASAAVA